MSEPAVICTKDMISGVINGKSFNIDRSHMNFNAVKMAIKNKDLALIEDLVRPTDMVKAFSNGKCEVIDGTVHYNGQPLHNCITDRILDLMDEGMPFEPLLRFLEKLMSNPSFNSREQLYKFLEHKNLPITEDGDFLAYKAITSNWYDKHTGTIYNGIGSVVSVPRSGVDDNPNNHCSHGLHVGCIDYINWFSWPGDRQVIVKVNPADAISVPTDHNYQKLRCCKYTVLCEYKGPLGGSLYTNSGEQKVSWTQDQDDENDWNMEDDEEFFDEFLDDEDERGWE